MPSPTLLGKTTEDGLPTAFNVATPTDSAATTFDDSAVVSGSDVADEPPALRWEDAAAEGPGLPAALTTIMVASAATTSPTGTNAVRTGWRERNRVGRVAVAAAVAVALAVAEWLADFLVVCRAERDGPEGDFDMVVFSLDRSVRIGGRPWRTAHTFGWLEWEEAGLRPSGMLPTPSRHVAVRRMEARARRGAGSS